MSAALKGENLEPGWLAFSPLGQATNASANLYPKDGYQVMSERLAKKLKSQGVAGIAGVPKENGNRVWLTLLASGSNKVDVIEIDKNDLRSIDEAVRRLDTVPPVLGRSLGFVVADVSGLRGAVVVTIAAGSEAARVGILGGDVVVRLDGQEVASASALETVLCSRRTGERIGVDIKSASGVDKHVVLPVSSTLRLISHYDRTLLFNRLIVGYRARLAEADPEEVQALHLNLAVAQMAAGANEEAAELFEAIAIRLPPGVGSIGRGTVQYLLSECRKALMDRVREEKALSEAANDPDALLTENGPAIGDLPRMKEWLAKSKR
jgi:hypothetical protein